MVHRSVGAAREADICWLSTPQVSRKPLQTVRSEIKTNQGQMAHEAAQKVTEAVVLDVASTWS